MELLLTTTADLQRVVDASVEAATTKLLSRIRPNESKPKAWLTNKEAMAFLGLSKATLSRYRASGKLPYSKVGGNVYYKFDDVAALLEQHIVA